MTAQAYFIITEDQKNALADLAGDGHELDAKLIDHPFAGNMGSSFDGLYALEASIVNDSGSEDLLPLLANSQVHILDDGLLFAPHATEEADEAEEPKTLTPADPTHVDPAVHFDPVASAYSANSLGSEQPPVPAMPIVLPADTESHS